MAKGSQLSQLKSALNQAGISGRPQNGKKRKRSAPLDPQQKDKRAAKLEEIHRKLNPFDTKSTTVKHEVLGRKLKGVTGKPSQSKQAGLEQRRQGLMKDLQQRGRAGGVLDHRFGENNPTMTPEERMLERFTRERQRASKGSAFNLEDEDDLTHYGQSLSKLDDFDDANLGLGDDDEELDGKLNDEIVRKTHFGGFDEDEDEEDPDAPPRKKSKAEVMSEVIAKSKQHKILRQMDKEKEEEMRMALDQEFDSLRSLLYAAPPAAASETPSDTSPSLATFFDPSSTGSNNVPLGKPKTSEDIIADLQTGDADYDHHVRELAFNARAQPKDRTKTEEEVALEEKEALEKAERKRRKRMLGLEDSGSEDEEGGKRGKKRQRGGDDLEDDFDVDDGEDYPILGAGLQEGNGEFDSEDSEDSEAEDGQSEPDDEDEDESDHEDDDSDFESGEEGLSGGDSEAEDLVAPSKKPSKSKSNALPFTFPCPSSHEEFLGIVDGVADADVPTVIARIRTLHHPSLGEDNKFKLQKLNTVLLDHVLYLASPPKPKPDVLSSILPHLFALSESYPIQSAEAFVQKLSIMHKNLKRGLSKSATDPQSKTWPGIPELVLFRIIGQLWPASDMHHAVISPARVLMGAYLGLARIRSLVDIASGLFLSTLFLQYEELSKRLIPEAITFVVTVILMLAPHGFKSAQDIPGDFPLPDYELVNLKLGSGAKDLEVGKPELFSVLLGKSSLDDEQFGVDLLNTALTLVGKFAEMHKGSPAFIELYQPVSSIISKIKDKKLPNGLRSRISTLSDMLSRLLKFSQQARRPLALQEHKPIPIQTYVPKFDMNSSNFMRNRDPDHERNEAAKLRNQYKNEKKGAIRELRKDARFLASVQQKEQKEKDQAYNERMRKVHGSIEGERAEQKKMEKEKLREKKRSGRK